MKVAQEESSGNSTEVLPGADDLAVKVYQPQNKSSFCPKGNFLLGMFSDRKAGLITKYRNSGHELHKKFRGEKNVHFAGLFGNM